MELRSLLPSLVRSVIYPLHERLLSRKTMSYVRELEWSQWSAPDDLRRLQSEKLRNLFQHTNQSVPFYKERLADVGASVYAEDPLEILARLPFLTKDEIRASMSAMIWHGAPGDVFPHNTGGSSGEPLQFVVDRRRQGYDQAARIRTHRWFGVELGDRELLLWGSPIERQRTDEIKSLRDTLCNQRLLDAFNMSPTRVDEYLDEWDRFRPVCLFGYPSSVALFVEHARMRARRLNTKHLQAVFVTGEVCMSHDREAIESYFGVPVADCYGSREAGFIAHQCPKGGMHITAENVIVEIVRNGQSAPPCETGEIVITHLDAYAMPFIRYRTGDVGRLLPGRCACGRGLPLMDVVQGRTTDFLYLPDGTVKHALSIIYPLRETPGIRRFRVTQHEDFAVTVDVVADASVVGVGVESIARRVRPVLGEGIPIDVRLVDRMEAADSGKFRYVISHARPATAREGEAHHA